MLSPAELQRRVSVRPHLLISASSIFCHFRRRFRCGIELNNLWRFDSEAIRGKGNGFNRFLTFVFSLQT